MPQIKNKLFALKNQMGKDSRNIQITFPLYPSTDYAITLHGSDIDIETQLSDFIDGTAHLVGLTTGGPGAKPVIVVKKLGPHALITIVD